MDEQTFFRAMSSLGTHAMGVGADQAADDFIRQYPQYEAHRNKLKYHLRCVIAATTTSMELHQFMVAEVEKVNIANLRVGDKVHYVPPHYGDDYENGIVKEVRPEMDAAFVVYYCADDWDNYQNYTGALTACKDLKLGWRS